MGKRGKELVVKKDNLQFNYVAILVFAALFIFGLIYLISSFYISNVYFAPPSTIIFFEPPTPDDNDFENGTVEVNVSIEKDKFNELNFNWNGTNFKIYDNSLIFLYNFDNRGSLTENSTFIRDFGSKAMNLTCSACNELVQGGRYNGGIRSGFSEDNFWVGSDVDVLNSITISAWVNIVSVAPAQQVIITKSAGCTIDPDEWVFRISGTNDQPGFNCGGSLSEVSSLAIAKNQWNFVAVTFDQNTDQGELYVNGMSESFTNTNNCLVDSVPSIIVTDLSGCISRELNGTLDELKVWNRVLSSEEIREVYFSNLNKNDVNKWEFYINQSKDYNTVLDNGAYNYFASIIDALGNLETTEVRQINIGIEPPPAQPGCRILDQENGIYTLDQDVYSSGTCFQVTANNVSLDCKGNNINYSYSGSLGYGVELLGVNYTIVKNCNIIEGNAVGNSKYGVYSRSGRYGNFAGNKFVTIGYSSQGIFLEDSSYNIIKNNKIVTYGQEGEGVIFNRVNSTNVTDNNITTLTASSNADGIAFLSSSNNILRNNVIFVKGTSAAVEIMGNSENNVLYDSILSSPLNFDFRIQPTFSRVVNLTNVSLVNNKIDFLSTNGGVLNRHWYLEILAEESGNPLEDANIKGVDVNGKIKFSELTGSDGKVRKEVLSNFRNQTGYFDLNNYTIEATSFDGVNDTPISLNISNNKMLTFNFTGLVSTVPKIRILFPKSGDIVYVPKGAALANVSVNFNIFNININGKGGNHVHFKMSNVSNYSFSDIFMFYNGNDKLVEFNSNLGTTPFATWINNNTIRFNNVPLGDHRLSAHIANNAHSFIGNPEAEENVSFKVLEETDEVINQNGGGGGGGGNNVGGNNSGNRGNVDDGPKADPLSGDVTNLKEIKILNKTIFVKVQDGEKIVLDLGNDNKYSISFEASENGFNIIVSSGKYEIKEGSVIGITVGQKKVFVGISELDLKEAVIGFSLDEKKLKSEIEASMEFRHNLVYYVVLSIVILLILVVIFIIYLAINRLKEKSPNIMKSPFKKPVESEKKVENPTFKVLSKKSTI